MIVKWTCTSTRLFLFVVTAFTLTSCNTAPAPTKYVRDASFNCMENVFKLIKVARQNQVVNRRYTKEQVCTLYANRDSLPVINPSNVAIGGVVIQQSIQIGRSQPTFGEAFSACMSDRNVTEIGAPPASLQMQEMHYALSTISVSSCPSEFTSVFSNYKSEVLNIAKVLEKYPYLSTYDQNVIGLRKLPSNEMEKQIIDSRNVSVETYKQLVRVFAKNTGVCLGSRGYFECNSTNIPFSE
jgi:hypothetical protein